MYEAQNVFMQLHGASLSPCMVDKSDVVFFIGYFQCLMGKLSTFCPTLSAQLLLLNILWDQPLGGFFCVRRLYKLNNLKMMSMVYHLAHCILCWDRMPFFPQHVRQLFFLKGHNFLVFKTQTKSRYNHGPQFFLFHTFPNFRTSVLPYMLLFTYF